MTDKKRGAEDTVRLSTGTEDIKDLMADLDAPLKRKIRRLAATRPGTI